MRSVSLYFQVHKPLRLRKYRFFDIGTDHYYYDDYTNESLIRKAVDRSYIPANKILLDLIKEYGSQFKITFSISGQVLDLFELYAPDALESFQKLAATGVVEFTAEPNTHSLISLHNKQEFMQQVKEHERLIVQYFQKKPKVFANTALIYSNSIGEAVAELGYNTVLIEGAKQILGWKSPNYLYYNIMNPRQRILLRNYQLSDDLSFRFGNRSWSEYPLTAEKYVQWISSLNKKEENVNIFVDYDIFGNIHSHDSGIFHFLKALPKQVIKSKMQFSTGNEVSSRLQPVAALDIPHAVSWADAEKDLSTWLGNELQKDAFNKLFSHSEKVKHISDRKLQKDWKYLQSCDHFFYMSTRFFHDGHQGSPYESPYQAFINYMNVLSDFFIEVDKKSSFNNHNLITKTTTTMAKKATSKKSAKKGTKKATAKKAKAKKPAKKAAKKVVKKKAAPKKKKAAPKKKKAAPKKKAVKKAVKPTITPLI